MGDKVVRDFDFELLIEESTAELMHLKGRHQAIDLPFLRRPRILEPG